ncbi:hypothetical protein [Gordonia insulae]|uniref:hypothetical protein n=1 Tax=Gordonia insulae TaxID=2420509 RepID=UPI000F5C17C9|nr:hypothetical protein [Gordonia insulae]
MPSFYLKACDALTNTQWIDLFRRDGLTSDFESCELPTESIRLYQASTDESVSEGLSWSSNAATVFGAASFGTSREVFSVDMPTDRLLAYIGDGGSSRWADWVGGPVHGNLNEFVCDARGVKGIEKMANPTPASTIAFFRLRTGA